MLIKPMEDRIDPRIKRTRQLIKDAFVHLLSEKGFQTITVQDITDRATINRVTFYAHFEDKYALLEYTMREMFKEHLYKQLHECVSFSRANMEKLIISVCEFLTEIDQRCSPHQVQFDPLMEKQIKAELEGLLRSWLEKTSLGSINKTEPNTPPELAAMVASWAIYGAAIYWKQNKKNLTTSEFSQQALPLILCIFEPSTAGIQR